MRNFLCGRIVGLTLAGTFGYAGTFYGKDGSVKAPAGSQQSFDHFRQRQQFLRIQHLRQQADEDRLNQMTKPCGK